MAAEQNMIWSILPAKDPEGLKYVMSRLQGLHSFNRPDAEKEFLNDRGFGSHVIKGLSQLYHEHLLCDFSLIADGCRFRVHKALLASVSEYFRAMLTGSMVESRAGEVDLIGVTAEGLEPLIEYLYCGKIKLTEDTVADVLSAASHLQITAAVSLCEHFLLLNLTSTNCGTFLGLADLFTLTNVTCCIETFVRSNFAEICDNGQHEKIPLPLMLACLKGCEFVCTSEYELFCWVKQWIEFDLEARVKEAHVLMKHIKFPLMKNEEIETIKKTAAFMLENEDCSQFLEDALTYQQVTPHVQFSMQSDQTQIRSEPSLVCFSGDLDNHTRSQHMYVYTEDKTYWKKLPDTPVSFSKASTIVLSDYLFVCGGFIVEQEITNRCYGFDPRFWRWFQVKSMKNKRVNFPLVHCAGYIYALGGCCLKGLSSQNLSAVERFSMDANQWEGVGRMKDKLRRHASCVFEEEIYVSGGIKENLMVSNCLRTYNPKTRKWTVKSPMNNIHFDHSISVRGEKLYVVDGNQMEVEIYCPRSDQWTTCEDHRMSESVPFSASVIRFCDNLVYVSGNMSEDGDDFRYFNTGTRRFPGDDCPFDGGVCTCFDLDGLYGWFRWQYPEHVRYPHCGIIRLPQGVGDVITEI